MLADYSHSEFTAGDYTRGVYRRGSGPAVIVIAEMPGITPKVIEFADRVVELGCTAVVPHLFGEPGLDPNAMPRAKGAAHMVKTLAKACVAKEFAVWSTGKTSPIVTWLRALAAAEHERCGGPGVGAVGMCFTGGYALAMATDDRLVAPVLSQPSMPIAFGRTRGPALDISPEDFAVVKQRADRGDLELVGLRFCGDRLSPSGRFAFLERELGDSFVSVEIEGKGHSVVTEHLVDMEGHPTYAALGQVLDLFRRKLLTT